MIKIYDLSNPLHMVRYVAREKFAWPGGYELFIITNDGGLLCSFCVKENYRNVLHSTKYDFNDGWKAVFMGNDGELEDDYCSHCGKEMGIHDN